MVSGEHRDRHHIMAIKVVQTIESACTTGQSKDCVPPTSHLLSSKVLTEQSVGSRACLASLAHITTGGTSGCQKFLPEAIVSAALALPKASHLRPEDGWERQGNGQCLGGDTSLVQASHSCSPALPPLDTGELCRMRHVLFKQRDRHGFV